MENKHYNLFYIFQTDRNEHPIPPHFLQQLQEKLLSLCASKGMGSNALAKQTTQHSRPP